MKYLKLDETNNPKATSKPRGRPKKAPSTAQNAADSPDLPKLPTKKPRKSTATRAQAASSQFGATPQQNGNDIDADADRTFTVESNVFGGAAFDTSSISQPSPMAHIQQPNPVTNGRPIRPQPQIQQQPQISSQRTGSIPQDATRRASIAGGGNRRLSEVEQPVTGLTYDEFVASLLSKLNRYDSLRSAFNKLLTGLGLGYILKRYSVNIGTGSLRL